MGEIICTTAFFCARNLGGSGRVWAAGRQWSGSGLGFGVWVAGKGGRLGVGEALVPRWELASSPSLSQPRRGSSNVRAVSERPGPQRDPRPRAARVPGGGGVGVAGGGPLSEDALLAGPGEAARAAALQPASGQEPAQRRAGAEVPAALQVDAFGGGHLRTRGGRAAMASDGRGGRHAPTLSLTTPSFPAGTSRAAQGLRRPVSRGRPSAGTR